VTLDLVAVGDSTVDVVIPVPRFPAANEDSVHSSGMERHMGGSSNYLIMASRLGLKVGVADAVGDDDLGAYYVAGLEAEGVDTTHIRKRRGGRTTGCVVLLTDAGQHAYIGLDGSSRTFTPAELDEGYIASAKAFFMSGYPLAEAPISGAILKALRAAKGARRHVFFDPSPVADTIKAEVLREAVASTDTLILNDRELGLVTSVLGVKPEPENLLRLGACIVVLKMGADGCSFHTRSGSEHYAGFKVDVVDTTGAGDSFDAAIVYGMVKGWSRSDVATLANAIGAIKVGKRGAGRNVPTLAEIREFLGKLGALSGRL
jgi:ribokinase